MNRPLDITSCWTLRIARDEPKSSTPTPTPKSPPKTVMTLPLRTPCRLGLTLPAQKEYLDPRVQVPAITTTLQREPPGLQICLADTIPLIAQPLPVVFPTERLIAIIPTAFNPLLSNKKLFF